MDLALVRGSRPATGRAGLPFRKQTQRLALWYLLVLGLIVTHQLLMTTERHAWVMGTQHGAVGAAAPTAPRLAALVDMGHDQPAPAAPNMVFGDCPAQQAVLPLFILPLLLAAAAFAVASSGGKHLAIMGRYLARGHPPPLAQAQRRALLQVFQI